MKYLGILSFISLMSLTAGASQKEVGTCYTGTHCNCSPSLKRMTRAECSAALMDEGLFGVGSWKAAGSRKCEKIGTDKERPDNCNGR